MGKPARRWRLIGRSRAATGQDEPQPYNFTRDVIESAPSTSGAELSGSSTARG